MASKHPGFRNVQNKIAKKEGVSKESAGAILANATRKASKAAKKANPRLNKVKKDGGKTDSKSTEMKKTTKKKPMPKKKGDGGATGNGDGKKKTTTTSTSPQTKDVFKENKISTVKPEDKSKDYFNQTKPAKPELDRYGYPVQSQKNGGKPKKKSGGKMKSKGKKK